MEELSNQTGTAGGHERPATRAARSAPPDTASGAQRWLAERSQRLYPTQRRLSPVLSVESAGLRSSQQVLGTLAVDRFSALGTSAARPAPGACYDSHGCYSGSAVVAEDKVTLIYTGNVKFPDGSRTAYQCPAQASDRGEYRKLGPVLRCRRATAATYATRKCGVIRMPGTWCSARVTCRIAARCCCCAPAICATGKRWERSPVPA